MILSVTDFNDALPHFNAALMLGLVYNHQPVVVLHNYTTKYLFLKLKLPVENDIVIDVTVSYHHVYRCPVLSFRVYRCDVPLTSMDDLLALERPMTTSVPLVLESHHLLHQLWWCLHPCETLAYMDQFPITTGLEYLFAWWSTYGLQAVFPQLVLKHSHTQ